jgi:hypothetical protein
MTPATSIDDLLPVEDRLARTLADNAIGLFLEYRDVHGYEEAAAAMAAVRDVVEGATTVLIDPDLRARTVPEIGRVVEPPITSREIQ